MGVIFYTEIQAIDPRTEELRTYGDIITIEGCYCVEEANRLLQLSGKGYMKATGIVRGVYKTDIVN